LYGDAISPGHPQWTAQIHAQVRTLVVREISSDEQSLDESRLSDLKAKLVSALPAGDASLVLAEGIAARKAAALSQPLSKQRSELVRSLEKLELEMYLGAAESHGIVAPHFDVSKEKAERLPGSARECSIHALTGILHDALERRDVNMRGNAELALRTLIESDPDPTRRNELHVEVITNFAPFIF